MSAVPVSTVTLGVAAHLHDEGVAVWSDTGYQDTDRAITVKALPATPDTAVAVTVYDVDDDLVLPHVPVLVQFRFRAARGSRTAVDDFADEAFGVLHGRRFYVGDLLVQQCRRLSVAPLGADDNGREERADNYELVLQRP